MTQGFVWFHNHSENAGETPAFYQKLLGWQPVDGPPGTTMLAGEAGPVAAVSATEDKLQGWIPFAQVDDVDAATKKAVRLGAKVLKEKTRGPAGEFSIVRDPGGASLALWQKA